MAISTNDANLLRFLGFTPVFVPSIGMTYINPKDGTQLRESDTAGIQNYISQIRNVNQQNQQPTSTLSSSTGVTTAPGSTPGATLSQVLGSQLDTQPDKPQGISFFSSPPPSNTSVTPSTQDIINSYISNQGGVNSDFDNVQFGVTFDTSGIGTLEEREADQAAGRADLAAQTGGNVGISDTQNFNLDLFNKLGGLEEQFNSLSSDLTQDIAQRAGTFSPGGGGYEAIFKSISDAAQSNLQGIESELGNLLSPIQDSLKPLTEANQLGTQLAGGLGDLGGRLAGGLGDVSGGITQLGVNLGDLGSQLSGGLGQLGGNITSGLGDLAGGLGNLGSQLSGGLGQLGGQLSSGFGQLGGQLSGGLSSLGGQITGGLSDLSGGLGNLGSQLSSGLTSGLGSLGSNLGSLGSQLTSGLGQLGSNLGSLGTQLSSGLTSGLGQLGSNLGSLGTQLSSGLTSGLGALGSNLGGLGSSLAGGLGNLGGQLTSGLGQLGSNLGNLGGQLSGGISQLGSNIGGLGSSLAGGLGQLGGQLTSGLGQLGSNIGSLGGDLASGLTTGLGQLGSNLGQLGGDLAGGLGQLAGGLGEIGQGIITSNLQGFGSELGKFGTELSQGLSGIKDFIENNTRDFSSLDTFLNSDTGNLLKAGSGLGLVGGLLGSGPGGLASLLGGAGIAGLLGGGGIPGLDSGSSNDLKDFLLGTKPRIDKFQEDLFSQGQKDLFSNFTGLGLRDAPGVDSKTIQDALTENFSGLPTTQTTIPDFSGDTISGVGLLPDITGPSTNIVSAGDVETDFLSSLLPGKDDPSVLEAARHSIVDSLDIEGQDTLVGLQDIDAQTQQLDDFFTSNIQDPLLQQFEEEILPGIGRKFAGGNQFFGSERQRADDTARKNLIDSLTRERSRLGFDQFSQARDRALQAAQAEVAGGTGLSQVAVQEALGRGQLALEDLLGRGDLILQQGLGTQGQELQERELAQTGGLRLDELLQQGQIATGDQRIQRALANLEGDRLGRTTQLQAAELGQAGDRFNLESALQAASGRQQSQQTLADLLFRSQQANQQAQLQQNAQLAQILGIPQLENIAVSLPGSEGLLQGMLAGGAQAFGAALPGLMGLSDERYKEKVVSADSQIEELLDNLNPFSYNYIDERYGEGDRISIMAQDLEKSDMGKKMIQESEDGMKFIRYSIPAILAIQANLHKRLRSLGV